MKMARDVVSHFEQQVENLTQEKQQLEQQFQMSTSDDPLATVPAVVPESQPGLPSRDKVLLSLANWLSSVMNK